MDKKTPKATPASVQSAHLKRLIAEAERKGWKVTKK